MDSGVISQHWVMGDELEVFGLEAPIPGLIQCGKANENL